ncbi:MAG: citramalate synthase [Chloroflexi bacterium]|nr:citramalate synthase [Chloroflexota bacterium]MBK6712691.1 citramalate synthase [Chloroflexota bacterium]MBK7177836.1 citramalate synthase [Chloroflexota bacterium]MBK7916223.1 citramalate synthase [Chloroflexota bacterium]MBK8930794.1 citramalate synthase [Chloroflexota bacterium]
MSKVFLYDTTLRDGTQREGISYSLDDKIKIARKLDEFGIDYIEGGWPGSNPKDVDFFRKAASLNLKHAKITAFGSTRRKNADVANDPNIKALLDANTPVVTLVGKSWDLHVIDVLETTMEENLAMIGESVAFCRQQGKEVVYDAEHFFDGYKANPEYAVATVKTAAINGANSVVLCDTNGGSLPWEIEEIVRDVKGQLGNTAVGIHTHDDGGMGNANTLAAVRAGANQVQGTINGYGERVANANLCIVIPDLQLKMGRDCVPPEKLRDLTELSRYVAEVANLTHDSHYPFVGASAFAHKGGIHVAAMLKNPLSYQHIDPTLVGNQQRSVVSELSGRGNIVDKAVQFGLDTESLDLRRVLDQIKTLENKGFTYEGAEASVELMLRRTHPAYVPPFELIDFMVVVQQRRKRGMLAEATVKVRVGPKILHTAAEGNGPVNALDGALRAALVDVYPRLANVKLVDYKVRIIDSDNATAATTRVLIDTQLGANRWSTIGASANIIEASWLALADSMEYALLQ